MREMKRENNVLNSKVKILEDDMENLNEKIDISLKERNKLRKDQQSEPTSRSVSPTFTSSPLNYGPIGIDTMNNFVETKVNSKLWSTSGTPTSFTSNWDKYKLLEPAQLRRRLNSSNSTSNATTSNTNIKTITNVFDLTLNSFLGIGNANSGLVQQKSFR